MVTLSISAMPFSDSIMTNGELRHTNNVLNR